MEHNLRTKTVQAINKQIKNDTIRLTHKLQRTEGQWKPREKSELIDSLLRKYPINPVYGIKEDGIISIIDGVQRLSTIRDYLNDVFSLSKDIKPIVVNGTERDISKKKFSKLDDDIKDEILNSELQFYEMTNCTEKDVREIFKRQNSGVQLNPKQLRVVFGSDDFNETVYELSNHPFMDKVVSKVQRKNATDKDLIIQSFMLVSSTQEKEFTSFKIKDMNDYVANYADNFIDRQNIIKDALDKFDASFTDKIKIPVTSLPMIIYSGYRVVRDKKSFSKLVESVNNFIDTYDTNEEYKKFVQSGTSNPDMVKGRYDYWRGIVKTLQ